MAIRECLQSQLVPVNRLSGEAVRLATEIEHCEAVFVHVRRGDYSRCGFPTLSADYYMAACDAIRLASQSRSGMSFQKTRNGAAKLAVS